MHFWLDMKIWHISNCICKQYTLNNQAPKYVQQLIMKREQQDHNLRSNNKFLLEIPPSLSKNNFEDRAFSFAAPKLWKTLPENAKNAVSLLTFKKNLKTHLFQKFYRSWMRYSSALEQFAGISTIQIITITYYYLHYSWAFSRF